jgi:hypothetical protein
MTSIRARSRIAVNVLRMSFIPREGYAVSNIGGVRVFLSGL